MNALDIGQRAVVRMDAAIIGDVVAVVAPRRGIERQQPDRIDAELGDVVELLHQARKVADAVIVRIEERFDMQLIDDRVLVPERVLEHRAATDVRCSFHGRVPRPTGAMRQMQKGSVAGSSRICWHLPCQMKRCVAHQVLDGERAASGRPQRHSGTSIVGFLDCADRD